MGSRDWRIAGLKAQLRERDAAIAEMEAQLHQRDEVMAERAAGLEEWLDALIHLTLNDCKRRRKRD
ncbi:MAG: hypothetical protein ACE5OS_03190 [Anaerolineae bacterium]